MIKKTLVPTVCNILIAFTLTLVACIPFSAYTQSPTFAWAKQIGSGNNSTLSRSVAYDAAGNVYTTGYFSGTVDFDPGPGVFNLVCAGGDDIFISKLDAAGNFVWAKKIGGSDYEQGIDIGIDPSGNVVTMGIFGGTIDFDPGPGTFNLSTTNRKSTFVSKLDPNGNFVWAKGMETDQPNTSTIVGSVAFDASGNVYITRYFYVTTDFDPGPGTFNLASDGIYDIFVSKLDASGNFAWAKRIGGSDADYGTAIALDPSGNIYVTGSFSGTVDFDPGAGVVNLAAAGSQEIFVLKLNTSGNFIWAKKMGGVESESGTAIAIDASGNAFITGYFYGTADFDPGPGTFNLTPASSGNDDVFVCKLDASGNFAWAKRIGGSSGDRGYSITLDSTGNVYSTGEFTGTVDFDPGGGVFNLVATSGSTDAFISKLSADGNFVWAKNMGGGGSDNSESIALDASGSISITGRFSGPADFDPGPGVFELVGGGAYVVKLSPCAPPEVPILSASGSTVLCEGQSVTLSATNICAGCTVSWSNGQVGSGITVSMAGIYSAVYTSDCGSGPMSSDITITTIGSFTPTVQVNNLCQMAAPNGSGYQWYVNGVVIPGATGQFWSAQVTGYYVVTMTNPGGCFGTSDPVFAEACVSNTDELAEKIQVHLYPNPAQDRIFLDLQMSAPVNARFDLFSPDGRYVGALFEGILSSGGQVQEIELPELPAGAYGYRLSTDLGSKNGVIVLLQH